MTNYYAAPGPFTDLGGIASTLQTVDSALTHVRELLRPASPASLSGRVRVSVCDTRSAAEIYRIAVETARERPVEPPLGDSRSYCVLLVSLLRNASIAARVRSSFVDYLEDGRWTSRWLVEVFEPSGIRVIDPQLDKTLDSKTTKPVDADRLAAANVRTAPTAWLTTRRGPDEPRLYGFASHRGVGVLRESLYRDVCALNRLELLSTDHLFGFRDQQSMSQREYELLDRLAEAADSVSELPGELEVLFATTPELERSVLFQLGLVAPEHGDWPKSDEFLMEEILAGDEGDEGDEGVSADEDTEDRIATRMVRVRGAMENNLQNVDVDLPHGAFIVVTGLSGSGKSSLAFDTIYAASQRRFVESLSSYVRRYIDKIKAPKARLIDGLLPAISIEQKTISRNPRSTVGTISRTSPLVRLLFSRAGRRRCLQCGHPVEPVSPAALARRLNHSLLGLRTLEAAVDNVNLATVHRCLGRARHLGAEYGVTADGTRLPLDAGALAAAHDPRIVIAVNGQIMPDQVRNAFDIGDGVCIVRTAKGEVRVSDRPICPACRIASPELTSASFSANAEIAHCPTCGGVGMLLAVDENALIQDPSKSILDGALSWYTELRSGNQTGWPVGNLEAIAAFFGDDLEAPWGSMSAGFRSAVLYGLSDANRRKGRGTAPKVKGLVPEIERLHRSTESGISRKKYERFMKKSPCPACRGTGLKRQALAVELAGRTYDQVQDMTIDQLLRWIDDLLEGPRPKAMVIRPIAKEIRRRLVNIVNVGLPYLSLSRSAPTLSGGEGQRLRLARQLGIGLTGILYVLDEPSIGLHASDVDRLIGALRELKSLGNTVLVVEHDESTIRAADLVIDMGWGAGRDGGRITAEGTPAEIGVDAASLTGAYLTGRRSVLDGVPPPMPPDEKTGWIRLTGAHRHNLQDVDVALPMGRLTVVTGISGSGKSTLINEILAPALAAKVVGQPPIGAFRSLTVDRPISKVLEVDQAPIGRTPRSCPVTYLELMDDIRAVFADTPDARRAGLGVQHFSFNSDAGRCPNCKGLGSICIEMHFLPPVWTDCPECRGRRYKDFVLDLKWRGLAIADVLALDINEALVLFADVPRVARGFQMAADVGLGYLSLGQSAVSLSGGEAQRLKLGRELLGANTADCIYVLDEPTTGLHFADVNKLLKVMRRLVDRGHTMVVIEHNLDVIRAGDWVVDLGPEGGDKGGRVLYQGPWNGLLSCAESATGQWLAKAARTLQ